MIISIKKDNSSFKDFLAKQIQSMIPNNEFTFLLTSLDTAIKKHISVDLRFDTNHGLDVVSGTINDVELNIENEIDDISIKIIFIKKDGTLICFECDHVGSSTVTFNTNSSPGEFQKYYINDGKNGSVKIGFIFYKI